jgi:hypothetical protein
MQYDSIRTYYNTEKTDTNFTEVDSSHIYYFTKEYWKGGDIVQEEELWMRIVIKNGNAQIKAINRVNTNIEVNSGDKLVERDFDKKVWGGIESTDQSIIHKSIQNTFVNYINTATLFDTTENKVTDNSIRLFKQNFEDVAEVVNDMAEESDVTNISNYTTKILLGAEDEGVRFEIMDTNIIYKEVRLYDNIDSIYRVTIEVEKILHNGLNGKEYKKGEKSLTLEFIYYVYMKDKGGKALIMYIRKPEKTKRENRFFLDINQGSGSISYNNNSGNLYSDGELNFDFSNVSHTLISVGFQTNKLGKKYGWQYGLGYGITKFRNTINYDYTITIPDENGELYDKQIQIMNGRENITINTLVPYLGLYRNLYEKNQLKIIGGVNFQTMFKISNVVQSEAIVDYQAFYTFVRLDNIPGFFEDFDLDTQGELNKDLGISIIPVIQPYLNAVFPIKDKWGIAIGFNYGFNLNPIITGLENQEDILLENYGDSGFNTTQNYSESLKLNTISGQVQIYFNLN